MSYDHPSDAWHPLALHAEGLTPLQRANANIIAATLEHLGYDSRIGAAAIANAMRESKLGEHPFGDWNDELDRYRSVGLFQLSDGGAGKGYSVEQRQDPFLATMLMSAQMNGKTARQMATKYGQDFILEAWKEGASAPELAYLFAAQVERPKESVQWTISRDLVGKLWPLGIPEGRGRLYPYVTPRPPLVDEHGKVSAPSASIPTIRGPKGSESYVDTSEKGLEIVVRDGTRYGLPGYVPQGDHRFVVAGTDVGRIQIDGGYLYDVRKESRGLVFRAVEKLGAQPE